MNGMIKNAESLNKRWNINAKHALYHKDGDWYHYLKEFPGAYIDPYGYVKFLTEKEYISVEYLTFTEGAVHVPDNISSIPGYVRVIIDGKEYIPHKSSVKESKSYFGGSIKEVTLTVFERNRTARLKCIEHYGSNCQVCEFNFGEFYGDIGDGFIHVHHLTPIAKIGEKYKIDPIKDLIPVCPNCHNILHMQKTPLTIEQLREKLNSH